MRSVICVHERFDAIWPFAADYWHKRWQENGGCELYRTEDPDARAHQLVSDPVSVQRLVLLGFPAGPEDLEPFASLEECYHESQSYPKSQFNLSAKGIEEATARGVSFVLHRVDVYWGQSVSEFALALTLCALRRIPQTYAAMKESLEPWDYMPAVGKPGQRGAQFGDDIRFTNGTLAGKRVRVVGAGNIGARYSSFCTALGAKVAIWDPFAPDASFVVAGAERCFHLSELVKDSEIFVPMVPLKDDTRGLVTAELIDALPQGSLVVQATRAAVCDTEALYRRVLNNELALAADVFKPEPVALDSPLLGRDNVVHTPHNAGRTIDANRAWADDLISRFNPR
jgi:phosphoglycerate dehydrogenase-like enzyme